MKADEFIWGVCVVLVLLICGCATVPLPVKPTGLYYDVKIDSIAVTDADLKNKTYFISSAMKNISDSDIQFRKFAWYLENALSKIGYKRVDSKNADMIIRFAYGVGEPITEIETESYTSSVGYGYQVGWTWIYVPPKTKTVTTKETNYKRFLMVEAYDSKDNRSQLWRTKVSSWGWGTNLRIVLPRLIAAATYSFGTNTIDEYTRIYSNSARVLDIMRSSDTRDKGVFMDINRLGLMVEPLTRQDMLYLYERGEHAGVLVTSVDENSVAQIMGLRKYDIVLIVNNQTVSKPSVLLDEVQRTKADGEIQLTFFSWNKLRDITVTGHLK